MTEKHAWFIVEGRSTFKNNIEQLPDEQQTRVRITVENGPCIPPQQLLTTPAYLLATLERTLSAYARYAH